MINLLRYYDTTPVQEDPNSGPKGTGVARNLRLLEGIAEHGDVSGKVLRNKFGRLRGVILLVAAAVFGLTLVFERGWLDADTLADGDEIFVQRLKTADIIDQHLAVEIDEIV